MKERIVLGIDLGAQSVGWALLGYAGDSPHRIIEAGVRAFELGNLDDIEKGKDEPPGVERRQKRQIRRQLERRARRMRKVAYILQDAGLLPEGELLSGARRDAMLKDLDGKLEANPEYALSGNTTLPYALRAKALDEPLEPHALGRALYHLAHRRGFLSNRKAAQKDEEEGKVKAGIAELATKMEEIGARTLGEYLASVDPVEEKRLRGRWTSRQMYEDEFEAIWEAQQRHHPDILTQSLHDRLKYAIFYQRPLKSQKGLIGRCELEEGERRAPMALLIAQRFRYMQRLNDLRILFPDGTSRELDDEEKQRLIDALEQKEEMKFTSMRTFLKLPKGTTFNLAEGGETRLLGNKTAARLRKVFGARWDEMSQAEQQAVVGEVMGVTREETMAQRGREVWGLDDEAAKKLAKTHLEAGYLALSKKALKKLLPLIEAGMAFAEARKEVYGMDITGYVLDRLPPVRFFDTRNEKWISEDWLIDRYASNRPPQTLEVRNPIVMRALTELRKVLNNIIETHGKPDAIHIELARELKKSRDQRQRAWKDNRNREQERNDAIARIKAKTQIAEPTRTDILKVRLADECNWECPYTGKQISWSTLLGETPQFDIEHIVPFSRSLDDSFMNKSLCYHEENRSVKRNRTPYEAYSGTDKWDAMLERVKHFKGDAARAKLERFRREDTQGLEGFASQKLNDTRYASRLAAKYVGWLYGDEARSKVQVSTGQITAYLRNAWGLNGILGDGGTKSREDHRHHAVDALVIALIDRKMIHAMGSAAHKWEKTKGRSRGWWKEIPIPWDDFELEARQAIDNIVVSHRVNHRVRGALHQDTIYSPPRKDPNGKSWVAVRKVLDGNFKRKTAESIVDPAVRQAVIDWLDQHGGDAKKAFEDPQNHPYLEFADGRRIPIHRVRIRHNINPMRIGKDHRERYVKPGANQHMEILASKKAGKTRYEGIIVTRFEAAQRVRRGEPVVNRDHGPGKRFVCSLSPGDTVELTVDGERGYWRVRSVWENRMRVTRVNDARVEKDIPNAERPQPSVNPAMAKHELRKIAISPLGKAVPAND